MQLIKSLILSAFTLLSVFNTHPSPQKGSGNAILGESTSFSSSKPYTLGQALGCDNETACRELCSKPENIQRCLQVYNSLNASLEPTPTVSASSSSNSGVRYYTGSAVTPTAYPTMNPSQRQHYIQEIKTKLGCDYETTCRDVCSKPEYKEHCTEIFNTLYLTIIKSGSSSSSRSYASSSSLPHPSAYPTLTAQQSSEREALIRRIKEVLGCDYPTGCSTFCSRPENKSKCADFVSSFNRSKELPAASSSQARISPTPSLQQRPTSLNTDSLSRIRSEFQLAYQKIMAAGGADRDVKLKALQQEYYAVMSQRQNEAKASGAAVLRNVGEAKKTEATGEALFRERLMQVKNTTKRQVIQTIDTKIGSINEKAVTAMNTALDKLNTLLGNLNKQLFALPSTTPDLAMVETEAIDAQSAITDAQTAVLAQSAKDYPLSFSSDEAKLRSAIAPVVMQLTADIKRTHEAVVKARDAVVKVYADTNRIKTNSATAAPTGTGSAAAR